MRDLAAYQKFQQAVFEGYEEARRFEDQLQREEAFRQMTEGWNDYDWECYYEEQQFQEDWNRMTSEERQAYARQQDEIRRANQRWEDEQREKLLAESGFASLDDVPF